MRGGHLLRRLLARVSAVYPSPVLFRDLRNRCHGPGAIIAFRVTLDGMEPHITIITLGVDDLERSVAFYRDGLGFPTKGVIGTEFENGAVAFFNLKSGLKLALWPRKSLAADTGMPSQSSRGVELSLGHNVSSPDEVDAIMRQAQEAGGRTVKSAQPTFYGGYAGYFQDPDGHLWEIAFNPGIASLG